MLPGAEGPAHGDRIDVFIPGAQKSGTSSLLSALGEHPRVRRHANAEFRAFLDPTVDIGGAVRQEFETKRPDELWLAKSAGVLHSPSALRRMHAHNPDMRLIVILRDPVLRAHSAFWYARRTGDEHMTDFAEALRAESDRTDVPLARRPRVSYRRLSTYLGPLRQAADLFGRDNVHVVLFEDFVRDQQAIMARVHSWLGLPSHLSAGAPLHKNPARSVRSVTIARLLRPESGPVRVMKRVVPRSLGRQAREVAMRANQRSMVADPLDERVRRQLADEFSEHNRALATEFGLDMSGWTG